MKHFYNFILMRLDGVFLFIIENESSYNLRYFKVILFGEEYIPLLARLGQFQLDPACLTCPFNKDLREDEGFDGVNIHGCGGDVGASAHLADALAHDGVEVVFDVVVRSE